MSTKLVEQGFAGIRNEPGDSPSGSRPVGYDRPKCGPIGKMPFTLSVIETHQEKKKRFVRAVGEKGFGSLPVFVRQDGGLQQSLAVGKVENDSVMGRG